MLKYFVSRLISAVPVLLLVTVVVFMLMHLIPGDPVVAMLGDQATPDNVARLRAQLDLDKPIPVQYAIWIGRAMRGDLGRAIVSNQPIGRLVVAAVPATLELTLLSLAFAVVVGFTAGIIAAIRPGSPLDIFGSVFSLRGISMPAFWSGIILIFIFALKAGWLPASRYMPFVEDPLQSLRFMVLPTIVLGSMVGGVIMRQVRSSLLDVLTQEYVRVAWTVHR